MRVNWTCEDAQSTCIAHEIRKRAQKAENVLHVTWHWHINCLAVERTTNTQHCTRQFARGLRTQKGGCHQIAQSSRFSTSSWSRTRFPRNGQIVVPQLRAKPNRRNSHTLLKDSSQAPISRAHCHCSTSNWIRHRFAHRDGTNQQPLPPTCRSWQSRPSQAWVSAIRPERFRFYPDNQVLQVSLKTQDLWVLRWYWADSQKSPFGEATRCSDRTRWSEKTFFHLLTQRHWKRDISVTSTFLPKIRPNDFRTISFLIQAPRKTNDSEEIFEHNSHCR